MTDAKWVMGYGAFLFLCGLVGFLSNPAAAKTALISGSVFGGLCALCGWLLGRGIGAARWAALGTTVLLIGVFSWRSTASWQAVSAGQPKTVAAVLITLMLIGLLATVVRLVWRRTPAR